MSVVPIVPTVLVLSALCLLATTPSSAKPGKLPSKWKICRQNDPLFATCFKDAVSGAVHDLVDGESSLGVFPIDPLRLTHLEIAQGSGPVAINLSFKDLDMKGLRNLRFKSATADLKNYLMTADVVVDSPLILEGDYTINGRVLVLPITGAGRCNLTLEEPTLKLQQKGREVKKGGEVYMEVTEFSFALDTRKLHIYLENLFNGNKELGDSMNVFLNENSAEVLKELKPAISDGFGEAFKQISNRVFGRVPFNKVFPEK